MGAKKRGR